MADKIVIRGVKPYDGEYDFELAEEPLTTLEWRWVKKIANYLPLTMEEGWRGGDPDLFVAFAVIALRRAGKIDKQEALAVADRLADAPFDGATISFVGEELEEDGDVDVPPAEVSVSDSPRKDGGSSSSSTSDTPPAPPPSSTGHQDLPRYAESDLAI